MSIIYIMASVFDSPLEISQLLSHPFLAAVGADSHMAYSTVEFIRDVGFEGGDGAELGKALMLEFTYDVSNIEDGNPDNIIQTTSVNTFKIPLLAVVAVPSLRIQRVEVDLVLEVNQIVEENTTGRTHYRALGRLTSDRKIETESFSNYKVKMVAESIGDSPGMSALLKVLTNTASENITPAYVHIAPIQATWEESSKEVEIIIRHPINIQATDTIKIKFFGNATVAMNGTARSVLVGHNGTALTGVDWTVAGTTMSINNVVSNVIDKAPGPPASGYVKVKFKSADPPPTHVEVSVVPRSGTVQKARRATVERR